MSKDFWGLVGLAVLSMGVLAGCAVAPLREVPTSPDLYITTPKSISVINRTTESVTFGKMLIKLDPTAPWIRVVTDGKVTKEINYTNDEVQLGAASWKRQAMDELRSAGYKVLGQENLLFDQDESGKSRYVIGGVVSKMLLVTNRTFWTWTDMQTPIECQAGVNWEVFDTLDRRVVFKKSTLGYAKMPGLIKVTDESVLNAFKALLSDAAFVNLLAGAPGSTAVAAATPTLAPIALKVGDPISRSLPADMKPVMDAVFTLKPGVAVGSGFFISTDGYALTAYHVVSGLNNCPAILSDGRKVTARVVRFSRELDAALIKIDLNNTTPIAISKEIPPIGNEVFVLGTPLDPNLAKSVSKGIVSGTPEMKPGRLIIQTDAAVNPGNSGGPLVNAKGEAIGIVSMKVSHPGFEGIGFAVPLSPVTATFILK